MQNRPTQRTIGNSIVGMLRLTRPQNGIITFLSIASMGLIGDMPERLLPHLMLAAGAGFFMTAFGNASNDYLDVEIDKINRPNRPLPSKQITQNQALAVIVVCMFLSVAMGFMLGAIEFLFVTVTAALLSGYNAFLKRIPLVGNATVGLLTGAAFLFGGVAIGNPEAALYPALFAFLINMLRELLKDAEDVEGDLALSVITFPRIYGLDATKHLVTALAVLLIAVTAVPAITGAYNASYAIAAGAAVDLPLIAGILYLRNLFSMQRISRICILLKLLMITGLVAIVIGSTTRIYWGL